MKESISYSFLLNIVIVFIFICAAIIMGMFSYNKAFRANTIILRAIEKYEGYNCASKEEISKNLGTIGYNVPFTHTCKKSEKNCVVAETNKFKVVSYNLDGPTDGDYVNDTTGSLFVDANNSSQTRNYRYAVTTYMYIDVPVVNQLIKMSVTSRTNTMYEFRKIGAEDLNGTTKYFDAKNKIVDMHLGQNASLILNAYANAAVREKDTKVLTAYDPDYEARTRAKYDVDGNGIVNADDSTDVLRKYGDLTSKYGSCEAVKSYDNY